MVGIEVNPLYPVLHGQAAAEEEEEDAPHDVDMAVDTGMCKILRKPAHLRSPTERILAENWAKQNPFQL